MLFVDWASRKKRSANKGKERRGEGEEEGADADAEVVSEGRVGDPVRDLCKEGRSKASVGKRRVKEVAGIMVLDVFLGEFDRAGEQKLRWCVVDALHNVVKHALLKVHMLISR